jgi:hypothetical protein
MARNPLKTSTEERFPVFGKNASALRLRKRSGFGTFGGAFH